jgi:hypothetical protein
MAVSSLHLMGPFYFEPDDARKGSSPAKLEVDRMMLHQRNEKMQEQGKLQCPKLEDTTPSAMDSKGSWKNPVSHFDDDREPRRMPKDPFFSLEKTTLILQTSSLAKVGNSLLAFLEHKVSSSVDKVSIEKFSVKSQVFVGLSWCRIKVNLYYRDSAKDCVVEFQRRDGDLIAFHDVFNEATNYLKQHVQ